MTSGERELHAAGSATGRPLRVAVVGAGPSGVYAVQALLGAETAVDVDVFDRLPAPYGLVRYGVAPDHPKMRSVIRVLHEALAHSSVRFIGNVSFGVDVTRADLRAHYDAVIYATGTQGDRSLGIPGEDLPGSHGAAEFVAWYCGHPDAASRDFTLDARSVAVIGAGNVALDVARVIAKGPDEIGSTDVPEPVLTAFRDSQVTDIYLLGRRGPAQAKFTPVELREMGKLAGADVIVRPDELVLDAASETAVADSRQVGKNVELLREWSQRPLEGKPRRVHFRFLTSPVRILGESRVTGLTVERNALDGTGAAKGTGEHETVDVGMVFRAVGYRAEPLPGVPFDRGNDTVPHREGRVLDDGEVSPGEYVTGWAKRGPTGVIGTNKSDAAETVRSLFADADRLGSAARPDPGDMTRLLESRGADYVDWSGWLRLDTHEVDLGRTEGRERIKVPDLATMLAISRDGTDPGPGAAEAGPDTEAGKGTD